MKGWFCKKSDKYRATWRNSCLHSKMELGSWSKRKTTSILEHDPGRLDHWAHLFTLCHGTMYLHSHCHVTLQSPSSCWKSVLPLPIILVSVLRLALVRGKSVEMPCAEALVVPVQLAVVPCGPAISHENMPWELLVQGKTHEEDLNPTRSLAHGRPDITDIAVQPSPI